MGLPYLSKVSWMTIAVGSSAQGHQEDGARIGAADHVDIRFVEQVVVDVVFDEITGDRLQQHTFRESHAPFAEELVGGGNLAAGDAGQVADHAFDFGDFFLFQPLLQLLGGGCSYKPRKVHGFEVGARRRRFAAWLRG